MAYAYAAVTSLMVTIEQHFLQVQPDSILLQDTQQIEWLYQKLGYLQQFLNGSEATTDLEAQIRDVALEAEDIIELYLAKDSVDENPSHRFFTQLFHNLKPTDRSRIKFHRSLQQVTKRFDAVCGEVMRSRNINLPNGSSKRAKNPSRQSSSNLDSVMVGHDYELAMVKDELTRHSSKKLEILSIYGMGGLGKTTFCSSVYEDPLIVSHFDKRGWITVSQEYTIGQILLGLLCSVVDLTVDEIKKQKDPAQLLYKSLKGNRYLIVIDDVWTTDAWDNLKRYFPDDGNGSRIMLSTRLKEVATYASSRKPPHQLCFLDADESWNLFYEKVFARECFPPDFVKIGKDVAKKCQGLPLAIVVVASLLSKLNKRLDEWEKVAGSINSLLKLDVDQQCEGILSLSYNHLPHCLKACFLYFVIFPQDSEIPVKKLMRLWIAEGLLKVDGDKTLEEEAEKCLLDLIDRSLVLISKRSSDNKIKTCKVHDLLFGLCLARCRNENFVFVQSEHTNEPIHASQKGCRRICLQARISDKAHDLDFDQHTLKVARSLFISLEGNFVYIRLIFRNIEWSHLILLRVLDLSVNELILPKAIAGLVHLRYLAFTTNHEFPLPITISQLQNLQTLHIRTRPGMYIYLPNTIWNMPRLKHLLARSFVSDPPPSAEIDGKKCMVLENLQTFCGIYIWSLTKEVLKGTPNIKKLRIFCNHAITNSYNCCREGAHWFDNLASLNQLETLSFVVVFSPCRWIRPMLASLPSSINKLTICKTRLPWKDMDIVGMLPNLEVLKAKDKAFQGPEWEPAEEGFCRLKFLLLGDTNVLHWKATADHFPCLEHLILRCCNCLQKIPDGFVDIDTLQLIELDECRESAVASAQQIQQERQEYGDDILDVLVYNRA